MNNLTLTINGKTVTAPCEPRTHLADFLRETHNLTGTHIGCEHGVCGACTLIVDGVPTRSCITFATACDGAAITTIEGLDDDEIAAELRAAFSREHALQCGYCTPGMMVSAHDLVTRLETPDEHEIRVAMSGNLCRCTGYVGIVRAVQRVITDRRARGIAAIPGGGRDRLGPAGSGHALAVGASAAGASLRAPPATAVPAEAPAAPAPRRAAARPDDDWVPQTTMAQSFTVAYPADRVWAFFGNVDEVAGCLPGARLLGEPGDDGHVEGQIRVKVGPISAEFQGEADIRRDDASRTGRISGSGKDKRSNSATRGRIVYKVRQGATPDQTQVDVEIGFTLTGALAQFSRSGLVQDVANRLTALFVQNLEAKLRYETSGGAEPAPEIADTFDAGSLVSTVVIGRIRRFLAWLTGRK